MQASPTPQQTNKVCKNKTNELQKQTNKNKKTNKNQSPHPAKQQTINHKSSNKQPSSKASASITTAAPSSIQKHNDSTNTSNKQHWPPALHFGPRRQLPANMQSKNQTNSEANNQPN
jgi:hypothetical protein